MIRVSVQSLVALVEAVVPKKPGRGARRGAIERRCQATSSDMQRLALLAGPHPAKLRDDKDLYGMQKVRGSNSLSSTTRSEACGDPIKIIREQTGSKPDEAGWSRRRVIGEMCSIAGVSVEANQTSRESASVGHAGTFALTLMVAMAPGWSRMAFPCLPCSYIDLNRTAGSCWGSGTGTRMPCAGFTGARSLRTGGRGTAASASAMAGTPVYVSSAMSCALIWQRTRS
jgi:hypothetical protein